MAGEVDACNPPELEAPSGSARALKALEELEVSSGGMTPVVITGAWARNICCMSTVKRVATLGKEYTE